MKPPKKKPGERYQYPVEFQALVVRLMLCDPTFLLSYRRALDHEYFTDPELAWIAESTLAVFDRVKATPTPGTVLSRVVSKVPEGLDGGACEARARRMYRKGIPRDGAYVVDQVVEFGRHQRLKALLAQGPEYLSQGAFDDFARDVREATHLAADAAVDVYEYEARLKERIDNYEEGLQKCVPTGIAHVDRRLEGGGLGPGEMGVVIGLPGFHKTTLLCNIGMAARQRGLNVFHATFEVSAVKTARRYDCRISGTSLKEMLLNRRKVRRQIMAFNREHPGVLKIRWWPGKKCTMGDLEAQLKSLEAHTGFRPDVLISDYVAKMKPEGRYEAAFSRLGLAELYGEFRSLCGSMGIPGWTALQANRQGFQAMKAEEGVLTEENAAETFDPIRDADVVLTLNQTREERTSNELRIYCAKNRDGESQWVERVRIDPERYTVTGLKAPTARADNLEEHPVDEPRIPKGPPL